MSKSTISKTYQWNWQDENGSQCGWNWCTAFSIAEARKTAKKMESPAREYTYDVYTDSTRTATETRVGRNKGMFVDKRSLRRVSSASFMKTWNASYMD